MKTEKRAKLLEIAEIAVSHSGNRLRLAFNEEDESKRFQAEAKHFLKLDEKRIGRDIELYGFMGDEVVGWQQTLAMFLEEVVLPLKSALPESYAKAGEELRILGESVYTESVLPRWRELF